MFKNKKYVEIVLQNLLDGESYGQWLESTNSGVDNDYSGSCCRSIFYKIATMSIGVFDTSNTIKIKESKIMKSMEEKIQDALIEI